MLYLRHGTTAWSRAGRFTSHTDLPLDEAGRAEARAAGRAIADARLRVERVICSPATRARETSDLVLRSIRSDVPVTVDERLVEIDFGPLEGLTPKQAARPDRADADRFSAWHRGDTEDLPGVESLRAATDRVSGVFDEVARAAGLTLVVGHGYLGRLLIGRCVLGLPLANLRRLRLDPGRFAAVHWEGKLARLVAMNTVALTGLFP